jgi:hypothetical protein
MNSQDILLLNIAGAVAFLLWYAVSRGGGKRPTQLNMKAPETKPPPLAEDSAKVPTQNPQEVPFNPQQMYRRRVPANDKPKSEIVSEAQPKAVRPEKVLNVMFIYNSHSWDAYEVLGVPAGSSIVKVTEAYQKAIVNCDKDTMEFLEAAYQAILKKVN